MRRWAIVAATLLVAYPVRGEVFHVSKANVSGIEDGLTWSTAFTEIQAAIEIAAAGDQVWVAAATYDEWRNPQDGALLLRENIALYGGFAGDETALDARAPSLHETIVDGAAARLGEQAYHVIAAANGSRIDGFTIRGGAATASGATGNYGGGLLVVDASVEIAHCRFENNEAVLGGAVAHLEGGECLFEDVVFQNNAAASFGGAVYAEVDSLFSQCQFIQNNSFMGGAVALYEGSLEFGNCLFQENRALSRDGGAVWLNFNGSVLLDATAFVGNIAETDGGAVANWSGTVQMRNTILRGNQAQRAGGAVFTYAPVEMTHCTVYGNQARNDSAAVVNNGGALTVVNSDFQENTPVSVLNLSVQAAAVSYSNVPGGYPGNGNLDVVSQYRDAAAGDFRLRPGSPLIDKGATAPDVTTDFRGFPRPSGAGFDIGAMEFFDSDGDLMEDDWEEQYGLDPESSEDGALDADADGLTNAREFDLDTDPGNPDSPAREFYVAKLGDDTAAGTAEEPFQTVTHALDMARTFGNTRTIVVGAGLYEEAVVLPPGLTLRGAGADATEISYYNAPDTRHVVVEMGAGARLEDCRVTLPLLQAGFGVLVSMKDVSAVLERVTIDGRDSLFSIGVSVQGEASSAARISACRFRRLQVGIQTLDTSLTIAGSTFEGIQGNAVLVNLPDRKQAGDARVPVLGRSGDPDTGGNTFGAVVGYFVVNLTPNTVPAENNDWGLTDSLAISGKLFGPVDYRPFVTGKQGCLLACGVTPGESRGWPDAIIALSMALLLLRRTCRRVRDGSA